MLKAAQLISPAGICHIWELHLTSFFLVGGSPVAHFAQYNTATAHLNAAAAAASVSTL
jgi:hypothetical protein